MACMCEGHDGTLSETNSLENRAGLVGITTILAAYIENKRHNTLPPRALYHWPRVTMPKLTTTCWGAIRDIVRGPIIASGKKRSHYRQMQRRDIEEPTFRHRG